MSYYCTLAEARDELNATANTASDNALLRQVLTVSRRIDRIMNGLSDQPYFLPRIKAEKVLIDPRHINSAENSLLLRGLPPLLAITSVTADGTDVTSVVEGFPQGEPLIRKLRITSSGQSWYSYLNTRDPGYVVITGIWGCHSDYSNAWSQVDTLAAEQSAVAGSFTVSDADGADAYGITPRFSPGALIKIGSEFQLVTAVNTTTNVVTASRGQLGSTAVLHAISSLVYVWQVEDPIKRIAARQAALMVARKGAFQVETVDGVGTVSYPQDLLRELTDVLTEYMNL